MNDLSEFDEKRNQLKRITLLMWDDYSIERVIWGRINFDTHFELINS